MKISDIVGKRSADPIPSKGDEEADKLLKQREDIEKETLVEKELEELPQQPPQPQQQGFFSSHEQPRQRMPMQPTQEELMSEPFQQNSYKKILYMLSKLKNRYNNNRYNINHHNNNDQNNNTKNQLHNSNQNLKFLR